MDTKWKSRIANLVWLILFAYGVSGILSALLNENDYLEKNYFETSQFQEKEGHFKELFHAYELLLPLKEEIKQDIAVTSEEIDEYRYRYGNLTEQIASIEQQYHSRIEEAQAKEDQEAVNAYRSERDSKIDDITKNFENEEYVKEKIVKEEEGKIEEYFNKLEQSQGEYDFYQEAFVYYLRNTDTGTVYSNLSSKDSNNINDKNMYYVKNYPTKDHEYLELPDIPYFQGYEEVHDVLKIKDRFEGKIGISKSTPASNEIMVAYHTYGKERIAYLIFTIGAVISFIISLLIGKRMAIFQKLTGGRLQEIYNKIPLDLVLVSLVIFVPTTIAVINETSHLYMNFQWDDILIFLFWLTVLIGLTLVQIIYFYQRAKKLPYDEKEWKNTVAVKTVQMVRNAFLNRKVGTQILLILLVVFFFGVGTAGVLVEGGLIVFYLPATLLIGLPTFILIIKSIGYFNKILLNASALAKGDFEPDLPLKGKSVLANLADNINKMKYGAKQSQKAQAKSERLKTELITNVSHDLRTPLTSIITYTDLLKNPDLLEDEWKSYVEIIDRKSKRLKVLIDDLFEASKMASGNIELIKAKVDIVQLLQQSLAEYNETMESSNIHFRITNLDHPVYAHVDGQKLWRVFDNVIGNMFKYSLEHSRAYIQVVEDKHQVKITFKNVSKYELSEDPDELFERFKRGDTSRHTDGSGLGLAIAKSIMDLHEGSLDIEVDGDLFKVIIIIEKIGKF